MSARSNAMDAAMLSHLPGKPSLLLREAFFARDEGEDELRPYSGALPGSFLGGTRRTSR